MPKMSKMLSGLWRKLSPSAATPARDLPPVIVHDPEAEKPHDLDDPFFDREVQSRMADVIAHAGQKPNTDR